MQEKSKIRSIIFELFNPIERNISKNDNCIKYFKESILSKFFNSELTYSVLLQNS